MAAPITFNTALPVSDGEFILREQIILTQSSDDQNGIERDVTNVKAVSVIGYGVAQDLAIFAILPVVNIDRRIGATSSNVTGFGDATIMLRKEAVRWDGPGRTTRIAPFAGVIVPTGRRGRTGDGSLDLFAGAVLTVAATDMVFDSQIKYIANRKARGFARGDAISADASVQYRLFPKDVSDASNGFLFGVLEANITRSAKNRLAGIADPNSGGTQVSLSPGIQYAAKRWIAEAAVKIPVVNDLNGSALAPDYSIIVGIRLNF